MYVDGRVRANWLDELAQLIAACVAPHANAIQRVQDPETGAVFDASAADRHLDRLADGIDAVAEVIGCGEFAAAFRDDVARWRFDGLDTPPRFERTRNAAVVPGNLDVFFFVAPLDVAGIIAQFTYMFAIRYEPEELCALAQAFPASGTHRVNLRLLDSSEGIGECDIVLGEAHGPDRESGLVVSFPQVRASAVANHVLPDAIEASGRADWAAAGLAPSELYRAVSVLAHLEDLERAKRWYPLDDGWVVDYAGSVLDSIRVDAAAVVRAASLGVPYADAIVDLACFARLFPHRRDGQSAPIRRFLFAWLTRHGGGALRFRSGFLELDSLAVVDAFGEFLEAMEHLDALDVHDRRIEARLMMARYAGESGTRTGPAVGSGAGF